MIRFAFGLAAALLLSGCGSPEPEASPPSPPIYEVVSADGLIVEGWLVGTIHALPDNTDWQSNPIREAVDRSDTLVVEVNNHGGADAASALFAAKAAGASPLDLTARVPSALRPAMRDMLADGGQDAAALRDLDTWAAALVLAQRVRHGDPENGVDRALIKSFATREIIELEGLAFQFDLFDGLPEREQRDLLAAVVRDYRRWGDDPGHLTRKWLAGESEALIDPAQSALLADAELRETLLTRRNAAWVPKLVSLLEGERIVLVAVGAAHLPGPDGLAALLEDYGYTVRPIH